VAESDRQKRRVRLGRASMLATYAFSALLGFGSSLFWLMKAEAKQARQAIGPADLSLVHHDEIHPSHVSDGATHAG